MFLVSLDISKEMMLALEIVRILRTTKLYKWQAIGVVI